MECLRDITGDVKHHHLHNMVFAWFLHCKVTFSPILYSLWNSIIKASPGLDLRGRLSFTSTSLGRRWMPGVGGGGGEVTYIWNSSVDKICLLPLSYYLFIYTLIYLLHYVLIWILYNLYT